MVEILAVPGWPRPETTLAEWAARLAEQGAHAVITRESTGVSWLTADALGLHGYAVMEGKHVEAINFELNGPDTAPARQALARAAAALGWDLDEDDDTNIDDDTDE